MAANTPVEIVAARLRVHDVLTAYGPTARVARTPVVSLDGSMVTVVVADSSDTDASLRLVRMPVGLRVAVLRSPEAGFVRSTKTAKSSGARIVVLDLAAPDAEISPAEGERFATLCTVHHILRPQPGVSTADAQASHPEQWCSGCEEAARSMAHARVYGVGDARDTA